MVKWHLTKGDTLVYYFKYVGEVPLGLLFFCINLPSVKGGFFMEKTMPFDSEGNFTRVHNWDEDRQNDIDIASDRMDEEFDNYADGLNDCLLRDGRTTMMGDLKMGNFQVKNVAKGTVGTDAVNKTQLDDMVNTINNSKIYQTHEATGASIGLASNVDIYEVTIASLPTAISFVDDSLATDKYKTFELRIIKSIEGDISFPDNIKWEYNITPDLEAVGNYYLVFRKEPYSTYWLGSLQGRWEA